MFSVLTKIPSEFCLVANGKTFAQEVKLANANALILERILQFTAHQILIRFAVSKLVKTGAINKEFASMGNVIIHKIVSKVN